MEWAGLAVTALLLIGRSPADCYKEAVANVNTKRLLHLVSERFLSLSLDPAALADATPLGAGAVNIAKALHPMFIRLGGASTNSLHFTPESFDNASSITGGQWRSCHEFAQQAGVDLILSLNAMERVQRVWDSKNSLEIISFSHQNGLELAFQLGYRVTEMDGVSGAELGRDAVRLRMILDAFPRFTRAPVLAPDLEPSPAEARFLREFLREASDSLAALPILMRPVSIDEEDTLPSQGVLDMDALIWNALPRSGKGLPRKPLWIAESEVSGGSMGDAMGWIRRLGLAARAGYQVVLRQPHPSSLSTPSPDLWASLLYKALVGREVLDSRLAAGNKSAVHVFAHCTAPPSASSILDNMLNYERGSVTLYGVNSSPDYVRLSVRVGMKEEAMHVYTLTSDPLTSSVELNGQTLSTSSYGELPAVSPRVKRASRSLQAALPPRSVFFLVLPEARSRSCSLNPLLQAAEELAKKLALPEEPLSQPGHRGRSVDPDYEDTEATYVTFAKKKRMPASAEEHDYPVRYVTFSEDPWLGRFAESMIRSLDEQKEGSGGGGGGLLPPTPAAAPLVNLTAAPEAALELRAKRDVPDEVAVDAPPAAPADPDHKGTIEKKDVKEALEELTDEGEKLVKTIDKTMEKGGGDSGTRKRELGGCAGEGEEAGEKVEGGGVPGEAPGAGVEAAAVAEEAVKGVEGGLLGDGPGGTRPGPTSEERRVEDALRTVMNKVEARLAGSSPDSSRAILEGIVRENVDKGSAYEVGTDSPVEDLVRDSRGDKEAEVVRDSRGDKEAEVGKSGEEAKGEVGKKPKKIKPFDLKLLTAEEVKGRVEAFRHKLKMSREKLRSMAVPALPPPAIKERATFGEAKLPLLKTREDLQRLLASKELKLVPTLRARRQAPLDGCPDNDPWAYSRPQYHQPEYHQPEYHQPQYHQPQYHQPQYYRSRHPAPGYYLIPSHYHHHKGRSYPEEEAYRGRREEDEEDDDEDEEVVVEEDGVYRRRRRSLQDRLFRGEEGSVAEDLDAQNRVVLGMVLPLPPQPHLHSNLLAGQITAHKVLAGEMASQKNRLARVVGPKSSQPSFTQDDIFRDRVLNEEGSKDLFSLAKKFTALDKGGKVERESDILSVEEARRSGGEEEEEEEEEEDEEEWLRTAERVKTPLTTAAAKEEKKEKKRNQFIVGVVVDKLKSILGFVRDLVSGAQQPNRRFTS